MTNYALIGAAGYIAPRHLKAIKETGGDLTVAYDINDSVGIMDSHFPDAAFFTEFERFETHVHAQRRAGTAIDYVGICSPNYLHKAHMGFALRAGADAICEKPLVLDVSDIDDLAALEAETGRRINSILQLRLHPAIIALRDKVAAGDPDRIYDVDLGYFTSRGAWYHASWKGFDHKSGGIATNIGVHFYDMLSFIFGPNRANIVHHRGSDAAAGYLEFERARVRWVLSINRAHLPAHTPAGQTTHRSITVDGEEIEFSGGFTDLHTASYQNVLNGTGYGLDVVRPSIELVSHIRTAPIEPSRGEQHPDIAKVIGGMISANAFVHESAYIDPDVSIGAGTKIWHFVHVLSHTRIGKGCVLGQNVMAGPHVTIGDGCKVQNNVALYKGVTLEDDVFCGPSCVFTNVLTPRANVERKDEFGETRVKRGATIGANATIVCGNTLGAWCMIAAGAVVTRDVPDHGLMAGIPARRIGWVSRSGDRLGPDSVCPRTGERYVERDGILSLMEG